MVVIGVLSILLYMSQGILQKLFIVNKLTIIGINLILWAVACIISIFLSKRSFEKVLYVIGFIFLMVGGLASCILGLYVK